MVWYARIPSTAYASNEPRRQFCRVPQDAARDNQAVNSAEIKPYGWGFGQLADTQVCAS
jgi:hypothetical protein